VAEAQIDLQRVRYARHKLLSDALANRYYDSRENALEKLRFISSLARPNAPDIPLPVLERYLTSTEIRNNPIARGQAITGHGPL
jgi:hypothetical protein